MIAFLVALGLLLAGGLGALIAERRARARSTWVSALGAGGALAGGVVGAAGALIVLFGRREPGLALADPFDALFVQLDHLSALLLLPVFLVPALAAIYGAGTIAGERTQRPAGAWLAYDALVACGALVLAARSAPLFLAAWEGMALAASFLAGWAGEAWPAWPWRSVPEQRPAWHWLLGPQGGAAQGGMVALLACFVLLGPDWGPTDFRTVVSADAGGIMPELPFALVLVAFGATVLLATRYAWRAEAAMATPAHVPAALAAVLVPTAGYALVAATLMTGALAPWAGLVPMLAGCLSAVLGALRARRARDLAALADWTGIQHAGIVVAAIGLGVLAVADQLPAVALLAFAAALLHTLATALFLPLQALVAGAIAHATATLTLHRLGGLRRRMRDTATDALAGGLAGAGLPPLNGFPGILLLGGAGALALASRHTGAIVAGALVISTVAGVLALATRAWARALTASFLGPPRSTEAAAAREVRLPLRLPMHLLVALCVALALFPPLAFLAAARPAIALAARAGIGLANAVDVGLRLADWAGDAALTVLVLAGVVFGYRWLKGRTPRRPAPAHEASRADDAS